MTSQGRIVWRSGSESYELRAVLVDDAGAVLHEGRIIPYTFSEHAEESDARDASARDVTDWASANGVTVLDSIGGDRGDTWPVAPGPGVDPGLPASLEPSSRASRISLRRPPNA